MQGAQWPLVPGRAGQLGSGLRPAQLFWRLHPHHWCDQLDPAGADLRSWSLQSRGLPLGLREPRAPTGGSRASILQAAGSGGDRRFYLSCPPTCCLIISLSEGPRREEGHPLVVQTTPEGLGWSPVLDGGFLIQAVPSSFSLLPPPLLLTLGGRVKQRSCGCQVPPPLPLPQCKGCWDGIFSRQQIPAFEALGPT